MSNSKFDDQLIEALKVYRDSLLQKLPAEEALRQELSFSPRFESRMKKLFHRAAMTPGQVRRHLAGQVAIIVLVFALGFASLMSVEAIRIPVLRFLTEVHETFTRIVFGAEEDEGVADLPEEIEVVYLPGFLPEGFELAFELADTNLVIVSYVNGDDYFEWNQFCIGAALQVNTEGIALEELSLHGKDYLYYSNLGIQNLIWEEYGYSFICSGTLTKDLLIDIAESIQIKN